MTQFEQTMSAILSASAIDVMFDLTFVPMELSTNTPRTTSIITTHELDVSVASLDSVCSRQLQHIISHIDANRFTRKTDPPSCVKNIQATSRAKVDKSLALAV